jgi:hypothetical protein
MKRTILDLDLFLRNIKAFEIWCPEARGAF